MSRTRRVGLPLVSQDLASRKVSGTEETCGVYLCLTVITKVYLWGRLRPYRPTPSVPRMGGPSLGPRPDGASLRQLLPFPSPRYFRLPSRDTKPSTGPSGPRKTLFRSSPPVSLPLPHPLDEESQPDRRRGQSRS